MSKFTKFGSYWFKPKGMVHLVWIGGTGVLQSILSSLILKVYHAFAFKPITIKFGKFPNFWMLFQMTCTIFNSIDIECSYQEKICSYPVPCLFRTWPIDDLFRTSASNIFPRASLSKNADLMPRIHSKNELLFCL